jgi:hypothetical protein
MGNMIPFERKSVNKYGMLSIIHYHDTLDPDE